MVTGDHFFISFVAVYVTSLDFKLSIRSIAQNDRLLSGYNMGPATNDEACLYQVLHAFVFLGMARSFALLAFFTKIYVLYLALATSIKLLSRSVS